MTTPAPTPLNAAATVAVSNSAVTDVVPSGGVNEHAPVPGHATPLQPTNTESGVGIAVRVTCAFGAKLAWHAPPEPNVPQLIPPGEDVTVPRTKPATGLARDTPTVADSKSAVTVVIPAEGVNAHVPVPGQAGPLHPVKMECASGVAVRVTVVAGTKSEEHVPVM